MRSRDPHEPHRTATPLELLYDLCFVVAIAQAAAALHHSVHDGHGLAGAVHFAQLFFAIWWAWMGFCWFASAFDVDDARYRVKVLLQMVGVLVLAAGVPRAFEHQDFRLCVSGYAIMRVGLVAQWLRVWRELPEYRRAAARQVTGLVVLQCAWIAALWLPAAAWNLVWSCLVVGELLLPIWVEAARNTPWHPHHIAERYGLLTLIVLGESVLAATIAVQKAFEAGAVDASLLGVVAAAPVIVFSMWWIYFARPHHELLATTRAAFWWGYGHYFIFASAAAVGVGIACAVDDTSEEGHADAFWTGQALALPVACYLASYWLLVLRPCEAGCRRGVGFAIALVVVLLAPLTPSAAVVIAAALAALTVHVVRADARSEAEG